MWLALDLADSKLNDLGVIRTADDFEAALKLPLSRLYYCRVEFTLRGVLEQWGLRGLLLAALE